MGSQYSIVENIVIRSTPIKIQYNIFKPTQIPGSLEEQVLDCLEHVYGFNNNIEHQSMFFVTSTIMDTDELLCVAGLDILNKNPLFMETKTSEPNGTYILGLTSPSSQRKQGYERKLLHYILHLFQDNPAKVSLPLLIRADTDGFRRSETKDIYSQEGFSQTRYQTRLFWEWDGRSIKTREYRSKDEEFAKMLVDLSSSSSTTTTTSASAFATTSASSGGDVATFNPTTLFSLKNKDIKTSLKQQQRQQEEKQRLEEEAEDDLLGDAYLGQLTPEEQKKIQYYPATKRPVTLMKSMCKRVVKESELPSDKLYFPVVRYRRLYYTASLEKEREKQQEKYCGTFFYFEGHSSVLMDVGNAAAYGSKVHAYHTLLNGINNLKLQQQLEKLANRLFSEPPWSAVYNERFNRNHFEINWSRAFQELIVPFYFPVYQKRSDVHALLYMAGTPMYPSDKKQYNYSIFHDESIQPKKTLFRPQQTFGIGMDFGFHDWMDQKICTMAQILNIDCILLQREVGEFRVVSELLDTRLNSYDYLIRVSDRNTLQNPFIKPDEIYPTVWFREEQGFIYNQKVVFNVHLKPDLNRIAYNMLTPAII